VGERFHNLFVLASDEQGAFYFHPSDESLSLGIPERKKALGCSGFEGRQL
jgi:hypothetical protein